MSSKTYRAAVIGCGRISRPHAHAYQAIPNVELVAAADISQEALDTFGRELGVERLYLDPQEMLDQERPDVVSVCTWPPFHADPVVMACASGVRAVLCEKPMAVYLADADRMLHAAKESGTLLCINHQRRFAARYAAARALLDAGTIGKVTHITGICNGDALTDGTHLIDLVRFLNSDNPVTTVYGAIEMSYRGAVNPDGMGMREFNERRMRYGHHAESGSVGILTFQNGVRANLEMGNLSRGGYQRVFLDGTEGRIEISGDRPLEGEEWLRYRRASGGWDVPTIEEGRPFQKSVEGMLDVLENGGVHLLQGDSARANLEIIMAIYESARTRQLVKLPLDRADSPLEAMIASGEIPLN
ncbi:MAG TPA: Gfo/Idh/MocA family oxidoreductase [Chloroflexota bacterium]|nr:Gfo/Idh/MocA family oxidoreductase [Chloroflexota bacterium]